MSDDDPVISHRIQGVTFSLFTSKEIRKLSVKEITNPNSFDILNHPTTGGLYDPALGAIENQNLCETCGQAHTFCPGHMGHITLPLPVYNPFLFRLLYQLLQCACFQCHHVLAKPGQMCVFRKQMEALEHGHVSIVESMRDAYNALVVERGGDQGILEELEKMLSERIEHSQCGKSVQRDGQEEEHSSSNKKLNTKNVFALRQEMVKEFFRSKGFRGKSCPHCGAAPRQLRTEHNNKVFFATQKTVARRKQTLQQQREAELRKQAVAPEDIDALDNDSGGSDDDAGQLKSFNQTPQDYLTPMETRNHMRALWKNEANSLAVVLGALGMKMKGTRCPLDVFFLDVVPVPASRFRPLVNMRDRVFENQQTANYSRVISDSIIVRELLTEISKRQEKKDASETIETEMSSTVKNVPGSTLEEKLHNSWLHLQTKVNCVLDSDLDKLSTDKQPGIKQLLEKKEGLFRKHMMGKRVDYAARSVISPDPYINTDEIGVPLVFATKLTYPQPVTPWNFHELKQAIINGPDVHPGACYVENEHGRKIRLHAQDRNQREAIAKQLLTPSAGTTAMSPNKKVYRHLKNGDVMLLNRQPTLHRPSIQAHKVRVLPGEKTLRLHYANCKAYNADFDGDEMNAHFPQDELCRSESYHLASTHYQYLVPKDGTPLAGLIQDHMVSGVSLTMRGRHFNRGDYQQLVFAALTDKRGPVQQLPPCLLKPKRMWSGKQVLSTVLLNIIPPDKPPLNLKGKTKLSGKNWQSAKPRPLVEMLGIHGDSMGESEVVIRQGELLVGVLDKGHYGNTPYGLVHCCYELYGGAVSGRLLTSLAKLFTAFLQWKGFTLGVEDINVTSKADSKRHKLIKKGRKGGAEEAATALGLEPGVDPTTLFERLQQAHFCRDDGEMKDLDLAMKAKTDQINNDICKVLMPGGLEKKFPHNNLQLMVQSGAKGSSVNCMQISCLLGQIELEGRRPPLMMSGQFLPSFLPYNTSPRAGGFVDQRFLTGIRPQEYFFHCMAGREGLVDTAVKTSRSGYLQRCLIKHMEGLIVNYDLTVRDSDGSIVQFRYGDDGLDVMKTQFLRKQQFPFLIDNNEAVMSDDHLQSVKSKLDTTQAPKLYKKIKKWKKKTKGQTSKIKTSPFHKFVKKNSAKLLALLPEEAKEGLHEATGRSIAVEKLCEVWANMDEYHRSKYSKYLGDFPDPVLTQLQPDRYFGAVSEKFEDIVDQYFQKNPDGLLVKRHESQPGLGQMTADKFRDLLYMSSMQSLAPPGEAVGLLAAQSIGEPSTQMTLNTFHFAGRGEMNVTLGIPRLREILMVASANIRTPTMDIPLLDTRYAEDHAQYLKDKLNKIHLSQVLEEAEVRETLTVKNQRHKSRAYTIKFKFLPPDVYSSEITVAPSSILRYMEHRFLKQFSNSIRKRMEELQKCRLLSTARRRERPAPSAGADQAMQASNDDVLDDDQNEDDSVAVRNRQKQLDEQDYEGEDEEKEELGEDSESDEAYSSESETEQLGSLEQSESSLGSMQEALNVEGGSQPGSSQGKKKRKKKEKKEMDPRRVNTVLSSANSIQSYEYDATKERWCKVTYQYPLSHSKLDMATLLESEAKKAVLYQTPKISRSFLSQSKKPGEEGLMRLKTEGINIQEMFKYERILDLNKLYTNDIHATAEFYGIEAACQVLIKEVRDVFAAYGIQVDYRHLSLVADYMTFEGVYKAFNRIGLETNASPLQKMTFETTMHFLRNATTMGVCDDLKSPSARLVVGRTALSGTGSFDILQPLS